MFKRLLAAALLLPSISFAQYEFSSFTSTGRGGATTFATDYQCLGINPANLGWDWKFEGKKVAFGTAEMTYSIYSESLKKQDLRDNIRALFKSSTAADFTYDEKIQAARDFTQTGFAINVDVGSFGFAYTNPVFGGIAVRTNDRFQWYSKFGSTASELLFLGRTASYFDSLTIVNSMGDTVNIENNQNYSQDTIDQVISGFTNVPKKISEILKGSEITMSWTREWNLSYGRKLFGDSTFAMYAGIGFKYMQGLGMMDIRSNGDGTLEAFSSLSPVFEIDYGTAVTAANQVTGGGFPPKQVGQGFGVDFGLNVVIKNKLKIGAALINMGSIKWTGNVYTVKDTLLYDSQNPGLNNYNIFTQMSDIIGKNGFLEVSGEQERVVKLPSMARFGASLIIGKIAELGMDMIFPFNDVAGNYEKPVIGFGGDLTPVKWIRLQAGFMTGGNYDFQIPVGITIIAKGGTWEAGVASRDAITFFTENGPTLSLSTGFMRFRF